MIPDYRSRMAAREFIERTHKGRALGVCACEECVLGFAEVIQQERAKAFWQGVTSRVAAYWDRVAVEQRKRGFTGTLPDAIANRIRRWTAIETHDGVMPPPELSSPEDDE